MLIQSKIRDTWLTVIGGWLHRQRINSPRGADFEKMVDLLTINLTAAYWSERSTRSIRHLARHCAEQRLVVRDDHRALEEGSRATILNASVLSDLKSKGSGVIVCTFHLGPYRYVPAELGQLGFDCQIVVSADVVEKQGELFQKIAKVVGKKLDLVSAENPRSILRGMRSLKQGGLMLFYIDGNTGVGGVSGGQQHGAEFQLLSMPVKMRTGVAFLAEKAQVPVVLAFAYYDQYGKRLVEFLDPIPPPQNQSNEARLQQTIDIYRCFEKFLRKYPEQWEGWLYPYRFWSDMKRPPTVTSEQLKKSQQRIRELIEERRSDIICKANPLTVGILEVSDSNLIFDSVAQRVLSVSPITCKILRKAFGGIQLQYLTKSLDCEIAFLALEIAKLVLAGLLTLEGSHNSNLNVETNNTILS